MKPAPQAGSPPEQEWEYPSREQSSVSVAGSRYGVQVGTGRCRWHLETRFAGISRWPLLSRTIQTCPQDPQPTSIHFPTPGRIASVVVTTGRIQPGDTAIVPIHVPPPIEHELDTE